jgi:hypothetical protein
VKRRLQECPEQNSMLIGNSMLKRGGACVPEMLISAAVALALESTHIL